MDKFSKEAVEKFLNHSSEDVSDFVDVNKMFEVLKTTLPKSIANERVEVRDSSFCKGKGLFIKESVIGAEILMIEDPFAYVNLVEGASVYCDTNPFLAAVDAPKFFGDPDYITNDARRELPVTLSLMMTILDKLGNDNTTVRKWCKQFSHEKLEQLDMYKEPLKFGLKACKGEFPKLDKKTITMLFNTVHCNALISKSPLLIDIPYGAGLWLNAARINHSCDPNCMEIVAHGKLYLIAIRDIDADEELTMDYNRHYGSSVFCSMYRVQQNPTQKRGRDKGLYGFECTCNVCTKEEDAITSVANLSNIGVEDLKLTGEDLRKWNSNASLMYTSFYQLAKDYRPGAHRTLTMDEAARIRKSIVSILDDATKMIHMTKSNDPLELLGINPFSTLIKLILIELILRGKGTDFTPKRLKNAKAIAGYLIKSQKNNENLEQVEMAMIASALRILVDGYEGNTQFEHYEVVNFTESFIMNMSLLFWVPFVFPMLCMKENQLSFGSILGMMCFNLSQDQKINIYKTMEKRT